MKALILAILLATSLHADEAARARQYIEAHRSELGLDEKNEVRQSTIVLLLPTTYVFEQYYRGVKVRHASVMVIVRDGGSMEIRDLRVKNIDLEPRPKIRYAYAKELAERRLPQVTAEDPELLIISPDGFGDREVTDRNRLTWLVPMKSGPLQWEVYVDAGSGEVYKVVQTQMCFGPPPLPRR